MGTQEILVYTTPFFLHVRYWRNIRSNDANSNKHAYKK